jgi:hypothetical protein
MVSVGRHIGRRIQKAAMGSRAVNGFSLSSCWTPQTALDGETPNFWYKEGTRSGLTLPNSMSPGTGDASLLLPVVRKGGSRYFYLGDGGALDIGATDFSICGAFKDNSSATTIQYVIGKAVAGSVSGRYAIYKNITSKKLSCYIQTSSNTYTIETDTVCTIDTWYFVRMDINQATKKLRLFVNEVQYGADVDFLGTFGAPASQYKFYVGCSSNSAGSGTQNISAFSYGDWWVFNRLLLPAESLSLMNGGSLTGAKAHWTFNALTCYDVSGNGLHLTEGGTSTANLLEYAVKGSRHLLNIGYSLYETPDKAKYYVPYLDAGTAIVNPTVPAGYTKTADFAGDLLNHNLADSYLIMSSDTWDKSSTTIYGDAARAHAKYIVATPKYWHIEEFDRVLFNTYLNTDYKGKIYPKVTNNSITDRRKLTEIIEYATNKTGTDYTKVLTYTGDKNYVWDIDYYFEDDFYIVTTRGDKMLVFASDRYLKLSLDNGATFVNTLDLNGVTSIITKAKIFASGNVLFCGHQKAWYSDDNLATYQESTTLDYAGETFVPTVSNNFTIPHYYPNVVFDDYEMDVWNNYSNDAGTMNDNINIWYTVDDGVTVKSAFKYGVSNALWTARHGHGVVYNPNDGAYYALNGDGLSEAVDCRLLKGVYTKATDTWEWTQVAVGDANSLYLMGGMTFIGVNAIISSDSQDAAKHGIYKVPYGDLNDSGEFVKVYSYGGTITGACTDGNGVYIGNPHNTSIMIISKDNAVNFYKFYLTGGPAIGSGGAFFQQTQPNNQGYYRFDPLVDTETFAAFTKGTTLMLKITTL